MLASVPLMLIELNVVLAAGKHSQLIASRQCGCKSPECGNYLHSCAWVVVIPQAPQYGAKVVHSLKKNNEKQSIVSTNTDKYPHRQCNLLVLARADQVPVGDPPRIRPRFDLVVRGPDSSTAAPPLSQ
jgi:hypothetical protein